MKRTFAILFLACLGISSQAFGQQCDLVIEANDQIQYNLKEMHVKKSCGQVTVTLKHVGKLPITSMGHNWVLTKTADFMAVAMAGNSAGPPTYLPEGDSRIIAHTSMVGGGEQTSVTFDVSALEVGGDYTYFCTFPGHYALMNGKFILE